MKEGKLTFWAVVIFVVGIALGISGVVTYSHSRKQADIAAAQKHKWTPLSEVLCAVSSLPTKECREKRYGVRPQLIGKSASANVSGKNEFPGQRQKKSVEIQKEKRRIMQEEEDRLRKECMNDFSDVNREQCSKLNKMDFQEKMLPCLRKASASDYREWIIGYLKKGGRTSRVYDYPFSRDESWYVAKCNLTVFPLYGSDSVNIIVPKGIKVSGDTNFSALYLMDGFKMAGIDWVALYSDIN